jgi:hypothetical protein
VPAGGLHAFQNDADEPLSMLLGADGLRSHVDLVQAVLAAGGLLGGYAADVGSADEAGVGLLWCGAVAGERPAVKGTSSKPTTGAWRVYTPRAASGILGTTGHFRLVQSVDLFD